MSIHNNLRQLRLYSGMTQEQAAGKLGVARQTLSSYESGRTRPDIDMLVRLCDIYETDLDGMIYGQNRTLKAVQRVKKTAVLILILLIGLTLVSSSLLWSANHFFPVAEGWLTSAEQAVFESHRRLTGAWEAADKTILALSLLGFAALLMFMLTGKCVVPLKQKILYMMVLAGRNSAGSSALCRHRRRVFENRLLYDANLCHWPYAALFWSWPDHRTGAETEKACFRSMKQEARLSARLFSGPNGKDSCRVVDLVPAFG